MLGPLSPHRQDRRPEVRRAFMLATALLLFFPLSISGCYWLKYGKLMRTHIDLLLSMARKLNDLLEDHRPIVPQEFSYPLERARDFVRIVSSRYAGQRSLQAFNDFLDAYAEVVKEADRLQRQNEDRSGFRKRVAALQEQGEKVKAILAEEGS
jgi:hypothetical protein